MQQGHFHVHTSRVKGGKGQSSVAAAAYQSGQSLTHEQQRHSSIGLEHRSDLNTGIVSDALRESLAHPEAELTDEKKNIRRRPSGITLSDDATVEKLGRRKWQITDGEQHYTIREIEKKATDPETGKRKTVSRSLDVYADRTHHYRTREDVKETWVQVPSQAEGWMQDMASQGMKVRPDTRQALWQAVEQSEVNRDAVPALKVELSFSRALPYETNKALARAFIHEHFTEKGYVADAAIHSKQASDGKDNTHVHVLTSTRPLKADGAFARNKRSLWNEGLNAPDFAERLRKSWADKQNAALEQTNSQVRVDPRSYAEQGLNKEAGVHVGYHDWNAEQKRDKDGRRVRTLRGDKNREVKHRNQARTFGEQETEFHYSQEDIDAYYARKWQQENTIDEPVLRFDTTEKPHNDASKTSSKEQAKPRGTRVRSAEEREMLARMQPYMDSVTWDDPRDKAHFIATTMHAMVQKKQQERQSVFDRYAGKRDTSRYRAIWQDRPLPSDTERRREKGNRGGR